MKRSPLRRRTPLRRASWFDEVRALPEAIKTGGLQRTNRLNPRRAKPRRTEQFRSREYLDAVKALGRCAAAELANAGECWGPVDPDHYGSRGMGQKTSDANVYSICRHHHIQRHALSGPFKGWDRETLRRWCQEQIMVTWALLSTEPMITEAA